MPPPRYLYRVFDETSISTLDEEEGFVAASDSPFNRHRRGAKDVVERHMDWNNRSPTPFISTTTLRKAEHYAQQRVDWGREEVRIARISTAAMREAGVRIFHMTTLVQDVGASITPESWNHAEYLCLHQIPREAVVNDWSYGSSSP